MQSKEIRRVKTIFYVLIALSIISFVIFQSRNIITGPRINIDSPLNGAVMDESVTIIEGTTENISEIKLNGRNISVDEEGDFKEKLLLSYGYNTIILEAKDRFNRKIVKKLELVLK